MKFDTEDQVLSMSLDEKYGTFSNSPILVDNENDLYLIFEYFFGQDIKQTLKWSEMKDLTFLWRFLGSMLPQYMALSVSFVSV